ncbi:MAG: vanomycin resistance protein VanB [Candidatus Viridilinea halotolerans]|uniref:Vanomycin resistance protein VanB n=1 Tax=Candidatus Viridilinea halotolerans TaxID=2491704 RepID=A0A426TU67_9CHLR|nr:MAG: vanomycin resistance protein VanB [Candidatus Viridilinea halotolerans]
MSRYCLLFTLLFAMLVVTSPSQVSAAPPAQAPTPQAFVYFPETGHNVGFEVKVFFDAHGGVTTFGMPLTELLTAGDGLQAQYFEHARLEYDPAAPEGQRVAVTRAGALLAAGRTDAAFAWLAESPDPERVFFPESGHTLGGAFGWFWQSNGGLAAFGYPISEEFEEGDEASGTTRLVQYFERARLVYHPEYVGEPGEVTITPLGRQLLAADAVAARATAPVSAIALLGEATTGFPASSYERVTNISRATEMTHGSVVPAGAEFSFLAIGDFSEANGFVEGYGIVGGRLERVLGGGLCQVSTTLFRAVANAGMQITRRVGHSHVVNFYENILGFDATVFSPGVDFRWRNDTPGPVYVIGITDVARERLTFQIYGISDGRSVRYEGPTTRNWRQPGTPVWQLDRQLPEGAIRQMVHGRAGMDVTYTRIITRANGTNRVEPFFTRYLPWDDFYLYGPGVTPPSGVRVLPPRR